MKTIVLFLMEAVLLLPTFLCAQTQTPSLSEDWTPKVELVWPTPRPSLGDHDDHVYPAEINKIKRVKLPFDLFTFFENLDLALERDSDESDIDEKDVKKWKEDYQKLQELGWSKGEGLDMIREKWVRKRGSFGFVWFGRSIYFIDLMKPTEAIVLLSGTYGRDARPAKERGKFANEVDGIEIEKIGDDTYRIFAQGLGGDMKFGFSPSTEVWDYKLNSDFITYYDFSHSFGKDLEKNGHRDIVVYGEGYRQLGPGNVHYELQGLGVFSWNGKKWINISDKEKEFLAELSKIFPAYSL